MRRHRNRAVGGGVLQTTIPPAGYQRDCATHTVPNPSLSRLIKMDSGPPKPLHKICGGTGIQISNMTHRNIAKKIAISLADPPTPVMVSKIIISLAARVGIGAMRQGSAHVAEGHRLVHDDAEGPDVGLAVVPDGGPRGSVGPEGGIGVRGRKRFPLRSGAWAFVLPGRPTSGDHREIRSGRSRLG